MKLDEAQSFMNPGICPNCEKSLAIESTGSILKNYSLSCEACGTVWDNSAVFLQAIENQGIRTIREKGLERWPFQVPMILESAEIPYLVREGVGLREGRRVSYSSTSRGMSLRLAPGVWIREGSSGGSSESSDVMKLLDQGNLILSNKRLAFIGNKKQIDIPLNNIIAVDVRNDGFLYIARRNKKRIEAFQLALPNLMKEFILTAIEGKPLQNAGSTENITPNLNDNSIKTVPPIIPKGPEVVDYFKMVWAIIQIVVLLGIFAILLYFMYWMVVIFFF